MSLAQSSFARKKTYVCSTMFSFEQRSQRTAGDPDADHKPQSHHYMQEIIVSNVD